MPGLSIIQQSDFSGGMWSSQSAERIPANGALNILNGLIDDTGCIYRRGGTSYLEPTSGWPTGPIVWVWQGTLAGATQTLFATTTNIYTASGSTITNLGASPSHASGANRPAVLDGIMYFAGTVQTYDGTTFSGLGGIGGAYATTVANRLINCTLLSGVVRFSEVGTAGFLPDNFWLIPGGAMIVGLATVRDSCVVFTDRGVWVISNMAYNLTDADGNVQQRLDLYSPDMVLWGTGSAGVVGYHGGLIVPARDGVWLMRLGATSEVPPLQLLSRPITSRLRDYVAAGYQPGLAAVHHGHYFLPILSGTTLEDLLVCRLDLPSRPWTSFYSDMDAGLALAPSQDGKTLIVAQRGPSSDHRVANADFFGPTANDAGSTALQTVVVTRDYTTGNLNENTVIKTKIGYRAQTGTLSATARDPGKATSYTLAGSAPATGSELSTYTWPVTKRSRLMRFAFQDDAAASTGTTLQSLEVYVRQQGRQ